MVLAGVLGQSTFPLALISWAETVTPLSHNLPFAKAVADFERKLLADAIAEAGGVKAEAARRLGLDSNQIKYLCRKHGL